MKLRRFIAHLTVAGLLSSAATRADLVTVTNDIAAGTTVTWNATNTYLLNTVMYVQTNATLIIEPGTVIKGGTNAANLIARPGIPNLVSALWVTRGGKLYATGTVDKPIIFTMEGDDVNDPNDIPPTVTGQWGGVVIMGQATINSAFDIAGNGANPVTDVYEGVTSEGPNHEHRFGGSDDADSSGALRYVSIRHTGSQFAQDKELNSLTMGGVGSGTIIEYVESFASSDDAFEWWGGTVSAKHLVAAFCEDDDFDTDQGYRGTNQFWFGIKPPWNGSADSRGFETDGDTSQTILGDRLPFSQWSVHNVTLIGRGTNNVSFGGGSGWNARDEAAPNVFNSVIAGFNKGLLLDTDGLYHWTNSPARADARNNVWDVATASANANGNFVFSDVGRTNTVGAALLGGISYTNDVAGLDPRPQPGSPALANVLPGAPVPAAYRGAFSGPSDAWADGWTALSSLGYLSGGIPAPPISVAATASGGNFNLSWSGGSGPYTIQKKASLSDSEWVDVVTVANSNSAAVAIEGQSGFFRVVDRVILEVLLSGAAERPIPVTTPGLGTGTLVLDGRRLTLNISYSGLTGTVSLGHIHGPADVNTATGVLVDLIPTSLGVAGGTSGTIRGSVTISGSTVQHMLDGLTYVNIHTSAQGSGEIRGQATVQP